MPGTRTLSSLLCALLISACADDVERSATQLSTTQRPNVLLILADDLGIGDVGKYNPQSKVPTPAIDALAAAGMRFTDAHSPSAVCTPTRYGILTGRYCWRTPLKSGVLWGESVNFIDVDRLTLADVMQQAGYATAVVGKWHLGLGVAADQDLSEASDNSADEATTSTAATTEAMTDWSRPLIPGPLEHGFDEFFGIPASLDMPPYLYVRNQRPVQMATETIGASQRARSGGGGFWRAGPIAPDFHHAEVLPRVTAEATEFLQRRAQAIQSGDSRPFFLYLPLPAPHKPWLPTAQFRGRSGAGTYGDFATMVDHSVGQVLNVLQENGLAENTLVIFTSDNGAQWVPPDIARYGHRANADWRGQKADIHEGGHRVPFVLRWPGRIAAGAVRDELLCLTDIQASLAAILGVNLPADAAEDSVDQSSVWLGRAAVAPRNSIVHHSLHGMFSIRRGHWKLVLGRGSGGFTQPSYLKIQPGEATGQLYDLAADPAEMVNVFLENPEIVQELTALLDRYRAQGHSRS
jgi:arylsulfatase A